MRNLCRFAVVLSIFAALAAPSFADVLGVAAGNIEAVDPWFNAAGDCRVLLLNERFTTVDLTAASGLASLCEDSLFVDRFLAVPVRDNATICGGDHCSTFVATGVPLNGLILTEKK